MRKRSKKRISQDEKPWVNVFIHKEEPDDIDIYNRKTSQGTSGNRRFVQTKIYNSIEKTFIFRLINQYISQMQININLDRLVPIHQQLFRKYYTNKFINIAKAKNFCLFLGRGRTYNRKLFISRHAVRKLTKTGLISGLIKK